MTIFRNILIIFLFSSTVVMAAPASESSIKELLTVTQAETFVANLQTQVTLQMNRLVQLSLHGNRPTAKQQQAITHFKNSMAALVQEQMAWAKLEPIYIRLYKETFTGEEVAGMLSFYKTPIGQAVIHKMPTLVQKSTIALSKTLSDSTPKIQQINEDFITEMKTASK